MPYQQNLIDWSQYFSGQPQQQGVIFTPFTSPGSAFGAPDTGGHLQQAEKIAGDTAQADQYLQQAAGIAGTPVSLSPQEQNILTGFAQTGGVKIGGATDPYALLPHEQEQLNQQVDAINAQRKSAVTQQLGQLMKQGMDAQTAKLVAMKLNQNYDTQIQQLRTGYMEQVRQNRQQTYAGLVPQLSQFMGLQQGLQQQRYGQEMGLAGQAQGAQAQRFGQQMNLAEMAANLSAAKQGNLRTLTGFNLGQMMGGYPTGAGGGAGTWFAPGMGTQFAPMQPSAAYEPAGGGYGGGGQLPTSTADIYSNMGASNLFTPSPVGASPSQDYSTMADYFTPVGGRAPVMSSQGQPDPFSLRSPAGAAYFNSVVPQPGGASLTF